MRKRSVALAAMMLLGAHAGASIAASPAPNTVVFSKLAMPPAAPAWLPPAWHSMLAAPLPSLLTPFGSPAVFPQTQINLDGSGQIETYAPGGATYTATNAFFLPLGVNGRTCATCHAPENAMSVSVASIKQRYAASLGRDPIFAPVDGATCPKNVSAGSTLGSLIGGLLGLSAPAASPYATILNKGLFRIALPVPAGAQFTVSVVSDPYGCNTTAQYNQVVNTNGSTQQILSVYRRPLPAANLKFKVNTAVNTGILPPIDLVDGAPLATYTPIPGTSYGSAGNGSIETGNIENGNIMADGREPTLASQAIDATLTHAQATTPPTPAQVAQILAFEDGVYSAQSNDFLAGSLTSGGVTGGPLALSTTAIGSILIPGATTGPTQVISLYNAWNPANGLELPQRASVYRGQQIFNSRAFNISNVSGFNNAIGFTNPLQGACSTCHGQVGVANDPTAQNQLDIGVGGDLSKLGGPAPATDLPVFKLTCTGGATTPFNGSVVLTNDPGKALITGKCADIGRFTVSPMRGLAARAPYFTDGSAPALSDVVKFYNDRFNIGLSNQDKQDLANFLNTL